MKNFDPIERLRKEYDDELYYNYCISAAISQGEHDLVEQFLQKVPNTENKGD